MKVKIRGRGCRNKKRMLLETGWRCSVDVNEVLYKIFKNRKKYV